METYGKHKYFSGLNYHNKLKVSKQVFFVPGKIPNPEEQPAYIKNSWLRQF